jgi:hypothetical protein
MIAAVSAGRSVWRDDDERDQAARPPPGSQSWEEDLMAAPLAVQDPLPVLRTALITAHAISGTAAFILGVLLAARRGHHPAQALGYLIALTLMALLVTGAVILDWPTLAPAIRGIFTALLTLATYTVWRGYQARTKLTAAGSSLPGALDDLSFTLITLFTGFVVILANDLGGPVWLVVTLGVLAVVVGRRLAGLIKARRLQAEHANTPESSAPNREGADAAGQGRR